MNYLVDTNVISETMKDNPEPKVLAWMAKNEAHIYLSVVTIGEIRFGIERLTEGKRKLRFQAWLERLNEIMSGRILSYNRATAHIWGQMQAAMEKEGELIPVVDGLIAATAQRNQLIVATRNTKDFEPSGVACVNPFL